MTFFQDASNFIVSVGRVTPNGVTLLGTAFFVGNGMLATTKHVTSGDDSNLIIIPPRNRSFTEYQDTSDPSVQCIEATISDIDPFKDICILKIKNEIIPPYTLSGTDSVHPGSPVVTYGFPHANNGRMVLTQQNTHVGAKILIESSGLKSKHVVLNTLARPGQSGGPVIDTSRMSVVGMLIGAFTPEGSGSILIGGLDPLSINQTTHAISAEYIKEML